MSDLHKKGFAKATLSGDAWTCCKQIIGADPHGKTYPHNWKWERNFPHIPIELDKRLRKGYIGGINYSANWGENVATADRPIYHEDIHSSYPSTMYADPLPCGIPTMTTEWPDDYQLYVAEIRVKMTIKEGLKPWYQFKHAYDNIIENWEYGTLVEQTREWHDMTLTSVDLITLSQWYDLEFDHDYPETFFIFKSCEGMLAPYID